MELWQSLLSYVSVLQELGIVLAGKIGDETRVFLTLLPPLFRKQVKQL